MTAFEESDRHRGAQPKVPPGLKEQLAIGGRLVIPVGEEERYQTLLKLTRKSDAEFEDENLGAVACRHIKVRARATL